MNFGLQAQYESYTRTELMQILDNKDGYTPEAVATASAIMDQRYPGWDAVEAHEAQLAQEERHVAVTQDLLDGLEDAVVPVDRLSKVAYWMVFGYLSSTVAFVSYYIFYRLFLEGAVSVMNWSLLAVAGFVTLVVLWFRKTRWGWNLVYVCLLIDFIYYAKLVASSPLVLPSPDHVGAFIINLVTDLKILAVPVCLWLAARRRTADMFGVVLPNRLFTVIVGAVLALSYLSLTWGE